MYMVTGVGIWGQWMVDKGTEMALEDGQVI